MDRSASARAIYYGPALCGCPVCPSPIQRSFGGFTATVSGFSVAAPSEIHLVVRMNDCLSHSRLSRGIGMAAPFQGAAIGLPTTPTFSSQHRGPASLSDLCLPQISLSDDRAALLQLLGEYAGSDSLFAQHVQRGLRDRLTTPLTTVEIDTQTRTRTGQHVGTSIGLPLDVGCGFEAEGLSFAEAPRFYSGEKRKLRRGKPTVSGGNPAKRPCLTPNPANTAMNRRDGGRAEPHGSASHLSFLPLPLEQRVQGFHGDVPALAPNMPGEHRENLWANNQSPCVEDQGLWTGANEDDEEEGMDSEEPAVYDSSSDDDAATMQGPTHQDFSFINQPNRANGSYSARLVDELVYVESAHEGVQVEAVALLERPQFVQTSSPSQDGEPDFRMMLRIEFHVGQQVYRPDTDTRHNITDLCAESDWGYHLPPDVERALVSHLWRGIEHVDDQEHFDAFQEVLNCTESRWSVVGLGCNVRFSRLRFIVEHELSDGSVQHYFVPLCAFILRTSVNDNKELYLHDAAQTYLVDSGLAMVDA